MMLVLLILSTSRSSVPPLSETQKGK